MNEAEELVRQFLRKWSTVELDAAARRALKEDARQTKTLLEVLGADTELLEEAEHAPDRQWFAKQFQELCTDA